MSNVTDNQPAGAYEVRKRGRTTEPGVPFATLAEAIVYKHEHPGVIVRVPPGKQQPVPERSEEATEES